MAIVGSDTAGTSTIESGPLPLVTLKTIGNGVYGGLGEIGWLAASAGDTVTEYHMYVRTRDRYDMTAEAGIYTYNQAHNGQDFNGVPIALFDNSIESLSPLVTRTPGWKAKTGLNVVLEDDDYCMCAGGNSGNSIVFYGDAIWAVSIDTGTLDLQTPWVHNNFNQAFWPSMYFVYEEGAEEGAVPQRTLVGVGI